MNQQANVTDAPLTQAQWAGLARLGDLGNRLGALVDGPLSGPATAGVDRLGRLYARHDLLELGENLIATVDALERAGLLRLIRDNAEFVGDSLDTLLPVLSQWMNRIAQLPVEDFQADLETLFKTLRRVRLMGDFIEEHLAGSLSASAVRLSGFLQDNETDQAIAELAVLLGKLHRNGLLARAGELTDYLAGLTEGTNVEALAGSMVEEASQVRFEQFSRLIHSAERAMQDVENDADHLGGVSGLVHLLRDKEVQKGLRMLSVLPAYMQQQKRTTNGSGARK